MTFTSKEKSQRPIKDTGFCARSKTNVKLQAQRKDLPFTKSVQTGKYFGVLVTVQAYAANQKLLVNLTDHRTWDVRAFTGHPRPLTYGSCSLLPCTLLELVEREKKEKKKKKKAPNWELKFISGLPTRILAMLHGSHAFSLNGIYTLDSSFLEVQITKFIQTKIPC